MALPDAPLQQTARPERRLIRGEPSYLEPRWSSAHWRVFEVADPRPLVRSGSGHARLLSLGPEGFTMHVRRPGTFTVLARPSPYWHVTRGGGCVGDRGRWTTLTVSRPGTVRAEIGFSMEGALRSAARSNRTC